MMSMKWPFISAIATTTKAKPALSLTDEQIRSRLVSIFKQLLRLQLPYPLLSIVPLSPLFVYKMRRQLGYRFPTLRFLWRL